MFKIFDKSIAREGKNKLNMSGQPKSIRAIFSHIRNLHRACSPDESAIIFEVLFKSKLAGTMLDVGANTGKSLARFSDNDWSVYAFEPDQRSRKILTEKYESKDSVHIDSRAVSDRSQPAARFYVSEESTGISTLSPFQDSHRQSGTVETLTLANFFDENIGFPDTIDFLKIDTEGYDLHVLNGFPWNTHSAEVVLCEFENHKTLKLGYSFEDLAGFLISKGYNLIIAEWYPIKRYGQRHRFRKFSRFPVVCLIPMHGGIF